MPNLSGLLFLWYCCFFLKSEREKKKKKRLITAKCNLRTVKDAAYIPLKKNPANPIRWDQFLAPCIIHMTLCLGGSKACLQSLFHDHLVAHLMHYYYYYYYYFLSLFWYPYFILYHIIGNGRWWLWSTFPLSCRGANIQPQQSEYVTYTDSWKVFRDCFHLQLVVIIGF